MVLIRSEKDDILIPYGTISKLCQDFPEFSARYLQNLGLSRIGKRYKGYVIYRVRQKQK